MRLVRLAVVLLAAAGLAGCATEAGDEGPGGRGAAPDFPARTNDKAKPVYLIHGFAPTILDAASANSDPSAWGLTKTYLQNQGFSGPFLTVGYYGCDIGFDVHIANYGTHTGTHGNGDCGAGIHTTNTEIEHLAQHLAWTMYDQYGKDWQCVDAIAHSMGGLVLRLALHGVETRQAGYPPELCVEDAVTLGTPHGGASIGAICAAATGVTQCRQMSDPQFVSNLAASAPRPQGSHATDWTTIASYGDAIIDFSSAVLLQAPSVTFLGSAVGHFLGSSSYQASDPAGAYAVRYNDGTPRIMNPAPGPIAWAADALHGTTFQFATGSPPLTPVATRLAPPTPVQVVPGQSVRFDASCANVNKDLLGGQWATRYASGAWVRESFDDVQVSSTPWEKSRTFTFPNAGSYEVRFTCLNDSLSESSVVWSVTADSSYNDVPTATRVAPIQASGTYQGSQLRFEATCANPNHDLSGARWSTSTTGTAWTTWEEDTVQFHADPWSTWTTIQFNGPGRYHIRADCIDEMGASDNVDWVIDVTQPAGPTAYRYAPTQASGTVATGTSVTFEAGCSNPNGDLNRGEWWVQVGGAWQLDDTDTVQWSSDPWNKEKTYTFNNAGNYGIRFKCINDDGGSGNVDWIVSVG